MRIFQAAEKVTRRALHGLCVSMVGLQAPFLGQASEAPDPLGLGGTIWGRVARERGDDPYLLYSIALAESRKRWGEDGLMRPWPYALQSRGQSIFPATRAEAKEELTRLTQQTSNIDIGLMQINWAHHGHRFPHLVTHPHDLLDPHTNIVVGASILAEALASAPELELSIGRYHSWTEARARAYGQRVLEIYVALRFPPVASAPRPSFLGR